ncbi:MAG TPA: hypothetical protein VGM97_09170 [Steroidobacteraceae bacterium]|jgi:predicted membrane-bound spermidine synthase
MTRFAWWLSFFVGFLSLSVEILWVRVIGFKFHTLPHAFSLVLAMYLIGIAAGAYIGKLCCSTPKYLYLAAGGVLLLGGAFDILTPSFVPVILSGGFDSGSLALASLAIIVAAAIKSILFPIAHHLGSDASGGVVGRSVSRIYSGNIAGSTLGPLLTGFYLLEYLSVEECFMLVGSIGLLLGGATALIGDRSRLRTVPFASSLALVAILQPWRSPDLIGSIADKWWDNKRAPVARVIQNRYGIIYTSHDPTHGDIVFGGNVYDGRINLDMDIDSNRLERAYLLAASHPHPQRVLVIGMGSGAWTRVISGFPGVEHIDVVEINPGYLELIADYPEVAPLLSDPRVHIHIDDGRRWLRRHPEEKFDLIVQNTTYHWRANATSLLSKEYFAEMKSHMQPGAIATYNTTGSLDVLRTAQEVFPNTFKYHNFVYVSDHDIRVPPQTVLARLRDCRIGDRPAFQPQHYEPGGVAYKLAHKGAEPTRADLAGKAGTMTEVITDQNMLSEYRHGLKIDLEPFSAFWPINPNDSIYVTAP